MENMIRDENGKFLPGHHVGRPKGSENKVNAEIKERFLGLLDHYGLERMKADLDSLEPVDRLKIVTGLLEFFVGKINRVDHSLGSVGDVVVVLPRQMETTYNPPIHTDVLSAEGGRWGALEIQEEDEDRPIES